MNAERSDQEKIAALARWLDYQFESPSIGNQVRAIGARLAEVAAEREAALARIAAVEAELDHARADAESHRQGADQWYRRAVSARARIAAVEALHFTRGRNILGKPVCAECSPLQPMPCPTLRALAASPTPTAAEKYAPCRDCGHDSADHRNDEPRPCKKRCRCVSFESPLPGQEKP